ncbi:MAG: hypothetical protein M1617_06050 [Actinobacteria bacterium]|nr:hypothetical protein [Actinomycetota bacterium]
MARKVLGGDRRTHLDEILALPPRNRLSPGAFQGSASIRGESADTGQGERAQGKGQTTP